ncbi:WXG100-like domain-containing protein [Actinophytocola gossypii]|uniref:Outer membrane channel protein CpnT-like N-terminal domain-containing protein n=1 Tax=Actinophytocola gossypii TaxID=2812003 RepID=A0ABT2JEE3_9PSEU|nr:hypothetical protein [Actinophytocola gossypii]MCT2585904.1 hypothetical protein [Actinophytocola gossypii]
MPEPQDPSGLWAKVKELAVYPIWPPDDESKVYALADKWFETATMLDEVAASFEAEAMRVASSWMDTVGARFLTGLVTLSTYYRHVAEQMRVFSGGVREYGDQILEAKISTIIEIAVSAPLYFALSRIPGGGRLANHVAHWVAGRLTTMITGIAARGIAGLARVTIEIGKEMFDGGFNNALTQVTSMLMGARERFNVREVGYNAIVEGVGGTLSEGLSLVGRWARAGMNNIIRKVGGNPDYELPSAPNTMAVRVITGGMRNGLVSPNATVIVDNYDDPEQLANWRNYRDAVAEQGLATAIVSTPRTIATDLAIQHNMQRFGPVGYELEALLGGGPGDGGGGGGDKLPAGPVPDGDSGPGGKEPGAAGPPGTGEPGTSTGGSTGNPGTSTGGSTENPGTSTGGSTENPGTSTGGSTENPGTSTGGSTENPGTSTGGSTGNPGTSTGGSATGPGGSAGGLTGGPGGAPGGVGGLGGSSTGAAGGPGDVSGGGQPHNPGGTQAGPAPGGAAAGPPPGADGGADGGSQSTAGSPGDGGGGAGRPTAPSGGGSDGGPPSRTMSGGGESGTQQQGTRNDSTDDGPRVSDTADQHQSNENQAAPDQPAGRPDADSTEGSTTGPTEVPSETGTSTNDSSGPAPNDSADDSRSGDQSAGPTGGLIAAGAPVAPAHTPGAPRAHPPPAGAPVAPAHTVSGPVLGTGTARDEQRRASDEDARESADAAKPNEVNGEPTLNGTDDDTGTESTTETATDSPDETAGTGTDDSAPAPVEMGGALAAAAAGVAGPDTGPQPRRPGPAPRHTRVDRGAPGSSIGALTGKTVIPAPSSPLGRRVYSGTAKRMPGFAAKADRTPKAALTERMIRELIGDVAKAAGIESIEKKADVYLGVRKGLSEFRFRVVVGETHDGNPAEFTVGDDGVGVIVVSPTLVSSTTAWLRGAMVKRALAHEISELNQILLGNDDHEVAHSHGRQAELRVLEAEHLAASAPRARNRVRRALVRHHMRLLAEEMRVHPTQDGSQQHKARLERPVERIVDQHFPIGSRASFHAFLQERNDGLPSHGWFMGTSLVTGTLPGFGVALVWGTAGGNPVFGGALALSTLVAGLGSGLIGRWYAKVSLDAADALKAKEAERHAYEAAQRIKEVLDPLLAAARGTAFADPADAPTEPPPIAEALTGLPKRWQRLVRWLPNLMGTVASGVMIPVGPFPGPVDPGAPPGTPPPVAEFSPRTFGGMLAASLAVLGGGPIVEKWFRTRQVAAELAQIEVQGDALTKQETEFVEGVIADFHMVRAWFDTIDGEKSQPPVVHAPPPRAPDYHGGGPNALHFGASLAPDSGAPMFRALVEIIGNLQGREALLTGALGASRSVTGVLIGAIVDRRFHETEMRILDERVRHDLTVDQAFRQQQRIELIKQVFERVLSEIQLAARQRIHGPDPAPQPKPVGAAERRRLVREADDRVRAERARVEARHAAAVAEDARAEAAAAELDAKRAGVAGDRGHPLVVAAEAAAARAVTATANAEAAEQVAAAAAARAGIAEQDATPNPAPNQGDDQAKPVSAVRRRLLHQAANAHAAAQKARAVADYTAMRAEQVEVAAEQAKITAEKATIAARAARAAEDPASPLSSESDQAAERAREARYREADARQEAVLARQRADQAAAEATRTLEAARTAADRAGLTAAEADANTPIGAPLISKAPAVPPEPRSTPLATPSGPAPSTVQSKRSYLRHGTVRNSLSWAAIGGAAWVVNSLHDTPIYPGYAVAALGVGSAIAIGGWVQRWRDRRATAEAEDRLIDADRAAAQETSKAAQGPRLDYLMNILLREIAVEESGTVADPDPAIEPTAPPSMTPTHIGPGHPWFTEYIRTMVDLENRALDQEPRPYLLFDRRLRGLTRLGAELRHIDELRERAERTGDRRELDQAIRDLDDTWFFYQRLMVTAKDMPEPGLAPAKLAEERAKYPLTLGRAPKVPGALLPAMADALAASRVTPGGRAFHPAADTASHAAAQDAEPRDGYYTVHVPDGWFGTDGLATVLRHDPTWQGQPVWVAGAGLTDEQAATLEQELGVKVRSDPPPPPGPSVTGAAGARPGFTAKDNRAPMARQTLRKLEHLLADENTRHRVAAAAGLADIVMDGPVNGWGVRADGGRFPFRVTVGPTQNGNPAEYTVVNGRTTIRFAPTLLASTPLWMRSIALKVGLGHELGEVNQKLLGNDAPDLLVGQNPGDRTETSAHDHGRQTELRVLDAEYRTATGPARVLKRIALRHHMRLLAEEISVHPTKANSRQLKTRLSADVERIVDEHFPVGSRGSWHARLGPQGDGVQSHKSFIVTALVTKTLPGFAVGVILGGALGNPTFGGAVALSALAVGLGDGLLGRWYAKKVKAATDAVKHREAEWHAYASAMLVKEMVDPLLAAARGTAFADPEHAPTEPVPDDYTRLTGVPALRDRLIHATPLVFGAAAASTMLPIASLVPTDPALGVASSRFDVSRAVLAMWLTGAAVTGATPFLERWFQQRKMAGQLTRYGQLRAPLSAQEAEFAAAVTNTLHMFMAWVDSVDEVRSQPHVVTPRPPAPPPDFGDWPGFAHFGAWSSRRGIQSTLRALLFYGPHLPNRDAALAGGLGVGRGLLATLVGAIADRIMFAKERGLHDRRDLHEFTTDQAFDQQLRYELIKDVLVSILPKIHAARMVRALGFDPATTPVGKAQRLRLAHAPHADPEARRARITAEYTALLGERAHRYATDATAAARVAGNAVDEAGVGPDHPLAQKAAAATARMKDAVAAAEDAARRAEAAATKAGLSAPPNLAGTGEQSAGQGRTTPVNAATRRLLTNAANTNAAAQRARVTAEHTAMRAEQARRDATDAGVAVGRARQEAEAAAARTAPRTDRPVNAAEQRRRDLADAAAERVRAAEEHAARTDRRRKVAERRAEAAASAAAEAAASARKAAARAGLSAADLDANTPVGAPMLSTPPAVAPEPRLTPLDLPTEPVPTTVAERRTYLRFGAIVGTAGWAGTALLAYAVNSLSTTPIVPGFLIAAFGAASAVGVGGWVARWKDRLSASQAKNERDVRKRESRQEASLAAQPERFRHLMTLFEREIAVEGRGTAVPTPDPVFEPTAPPSMTPTHIDAGHPWFTQYVRTMVELERAALDQEIRPYLLFDARLRGLAQLTADLRGIDELRRLAEETGDSRALDQAVRDLEDTWFFYQRLMATAKPMPRPGLSAAELAEERARHPFTLGRRPRIPGALLRSLADALVASEVTPNGRSFRPVGEASEEHEGYHNVHVPPGEQGFGVRPLATMLRFDPNWRGQDVWLHGTDLTPDELTALGRRLGVAVRAEPTHRLEPPRTPADLVAASVTTRAGRSFHAPERADLHELARWMPPVPDRHVLHVLGAIDHVVIEGEPRDAAEFAAVILADPSRGDRPVVVDAADIGVSAPFIEELRAHLDRAGVRVESDTTLADALLQSSVTPSGRAFFPADDTAAHEAARTVPRTPRFHTVQVRIAPDGGFQLGDRSVTPTEMARVFRHDPSWNRERTPGLWLVDPSGLVTTRHLDELASFLGAPVRADDTRVGDALAASKIVQGNRVFGEPLPTRPAFPPVHTLYAIGDLDGILVNGRLFDVEGTRRLITADPEWRGRPVHIAGPVGLRPEKLQELETLLGVPVTGDTTIADTLADSHPVRGGRSFLPDGAVLTPPRETYHTIHLHADQFSVTELKALIRHDPTRHGKDVVLAIAGPDIAPDHLADLRHALGVDITTAPSRPGGTSTPAPDPAGQSLGHTGLRFTSDALDALRATAGTDDLVLDVRSFAPTESDTEPDVPDGGDQLTPTHDTVHLHAAYAGLGLTVENPATGEPVDVEVVIVTDPSELAYLDRHGATARTRLLASGPQIRFAPTSFADSEMLVGTIAYQLTYVHHRLAGIRVTSENSDELEAAARAGQALAVVAYRETVADLEQDQFRPTASRGNTDVLASGDHLPLTPDTALQHAALAGITPTIEHPTTGEPVHVEFVTVTDPAELAYLDDHHASARTRILPTGPQLRLGPASFVDNETLVAAIAHEMTHVHQRLSGIRVTSDNRATLETEAHANETPALEEYRNNAANQVRRGQDIPAAGGRATGVGPAGEGSDRAGNGAAPGGHGTAGARTGTGVPDPDADRNEPADPADRPGGPDGAPGRSGADQQRVAPRPDPGKQQLRRDTSAVTVAAQETARAAAERARQAAERATAAAEHAEDVATQARTAADQNPATDTHARFAEDRAALAAKEARIAGLDADTATGAANRAAELATTDHVTRRALHRDAERARIAAQEADLAATQATVAADRAQRFAEQGRNAATAAAAAAGGTATEPKQETHQPTPGKRQLLRDGATAHETARAAAERARQAAEQATAAAEHAEDVATQARTAADQNPAADTHARFAEDRAALAAKEARIAGLDADTATGAANRAAELATTDHVTRRALHRNATRARITAQEAELAATQATTAADRAQRFAEQGRNAATAAAAIKPTDQANQQSDQPTTGEPARAEPDTPPTFPVRALPHSTFRVDSDAVPNRWIGEHARGAMSRVKDDAAMRGVEETRRGHYRVTRKDGSTFVVTVVAKEVQDGHPAEVVVIGADRGLIRVSPRLAEDLVDLAVASGLAQLGDRLAGNDVEQDLLTRDHHPGSASTLSAHDVGREAELRHLHRTRAAAAKQGLPHQRRHTKVWQALVEDMGVHPEEEGGPQRRAVTTADTRYLIDGFVANTRRPSWVHEPSGYTPWKAFIPVFGASILPGAAATAAIAGLSIASGGSLAVAAAVGVMNLGTAVAGTLVGRWYGRREKDMVDAGHGYYGKKRAYDIAEKRREPLNALLARMRTMGIDVNDPGPPEPPVTDPEPRQVQRYRNLLINRGLPPVIGAIAATPLLAVGLPPWNLVTHWGIAGFAAAFGPVAERYLRKRMVPREWTWFDEIARELDRRNARFDQRFLAHVHELLDRIDRIAGTNPPSVAPVREPIPDITIDNNPANRYGASAAPNSAGDFSRDATNAPSRMGNAVLDAVSATGSAALDAVGSGLTRFGLGVLIATFMDREFTSDEYDQIVKQVKFDSAATMTEQAAQRERNLLAMLDEVETRVEAAEADAFGRASPAADREPVVPAPPNPAARPPGHRDKRGFGKQGVLQAVALESIAVSAAIAFNQGAGMIIVVAAASAGILASFPMRYLHRRAEQHAVDRKIFADRAKERVVEAAESTAVRDFMGTLLTREAAAAERARERGHGRHQLAPMPVRPPMPANPGPEDVKAMVAYERELLFREPRPMSRLGARLVGLDRLERLADRALLFARVEAGNSAPAEQARADLAALWQAYRQLRDDGTPMPYDHELYLGTKRRVADQLRTFLEQSRAVPGGRVFFAAGDPLLDDPVGTPRHEDAYVLDVHGVEYGADGTAIRIGAHLLTVEHLDAILDLDPNYHGQPILLLACGSGRGVDSFAQRLADRRQVRVGGPSAYYGRDDNGAEFVTDVEVDASGIAHPKFPPTGEIRWFDPRRNNIAHLAPDLVEAPIYVGLGALDQHNPWRLRGGEYQPSRGERELAERTVVDRRAIGGRHAATVLLARLDDGSLTVLKPVHSEAVKTRNSDDALKMRLPVGGRLAQRDVAASRLDEMFGFGLVPTTTMVEDSRHGPASLQRFAERRNKGGIVDDFPWQRQQQLAVLDYVIGNLDRNPGNYLTSPAGDPVAIDNSYSFPHGTAYPIVSGFVASQLGQPLDREVLMAVLAVKPEAMRTMLLATGLGSVAVDLAVARLREIQRFKRILGTAWSGEITDPYGTVVPKLGPDDRPPRRPGKRFQLFGRNRGGAPPPPAPPRPDPGSPWSAAGGLPLEPDPDPDRLGPAREHDPADVLLHLYDRSMPYPGGRAFYAPGDALLDGITLVRPMPGYFTLDLHGGRHSVRVGNRLLNAEHLVLLAQRDPRWRGQPIRLLASRTGQDDDGIAQRLADLSGSPVMAPTGLVAAADGDIFVVDGDLTASGIPSRRSTTGEMRVFHPRVRRAPGPVAPRAIPELVDPPALDRHNPWGVRDGGPTDDEEPALLHREGALPPVDRLPMTMETVRRVAEKYGVDISGMVFELRPKRANIDGITRPDTTVVLCRRAFRHGEAWLARTLYHERFHVEELRAGLPYPETEWEEEPFENRAYDAEFSWWDAHPLNEDNPAFTPNVPDQPTIEVKGSGGTAVVVVHGRPTAAELAALIRQHPSWGGRDVRLRGSFVLSEEGRQELRNGLGVAVRG